MMTTAEDFLCQPEIHDLKIVDRFVALLWWHHHHNGGQAVDFDQMCTESQNSNYSAVDKTRERKKLVKDPRTTSQNAGKAFKLHIRAVKELDAAFLHLLADRPPPQSDTLFAMKDFVGTRGYIEKVVQQVNVSYDVQIYDCCAVMVRRLLETLIISIYESQGRADELKKDGIFMMFSGLLTYLENDKSINLGRNTITGLKDFKAIADSSAHNRRYNATKKNIDDKIDAVKLAIVELRQCVNWKQGFV